MYSDEAAVLNDSHARQQPTNPSTVRHPRPHQFYEPGLPQEPETGFGRHPTARFQWESPPRQPVARLGQPQDAFGATRTINPPSKGRHVTFSSQEPHIDKATGNIQHVRVPPTSEGQPRIPRSFSYSTEPSNTLNPGFKPRTKPASGPMSIQYDAANRPDQSPVSSEEKFVDGNYFFNHLVRNKEAEDYNMAEILRERSREMQRRRQFGRDATFRSFGKPQEDRLSTSLPADYFATRQAGKYAYQNDTRASTRPPLPPQQRASDTPFADGLEIEIPLRRNGGLRQSLSADRLLMVPPTHRDPTIYGKQFQRPDPPVDWPSSAGGIAPHLPAKLPPKPPRVIDTRNLSAINPKIMGSNTSPNHTKEPTDVGSDQTGYAPRYGRSGPEPVTNRYNVRTGRFEPDVETPPELPPKAVPPSRAAPIRYHPSDEIWDNRRNAHISATGIVPPRLPNKPQKSDYAPRFDTANRTWNNQFEGRAYPDPRLSVSFDPGRLREYDYRAQNMANATRDPRFQDVPGRKGVTWRDQEFPSLSRTHPTGSFHENLGYDNDQLDESSSRDETRSSFREGFSYPSSDSLLRSLAVNDLQNVDQFALFEVSTSKLGWAESFMGTNLLDKIKQYKFVVLNRHEEVLFFGAEDERSISNCILSPQKSSFKVRILDANGHDFVHFRRLYPVKPKTNFPMGNKKKYRLEVSTPSGHVIGNVEKTYNSDTYYILEDRAGACLFLVQRSCICTCPLFWDYEFKILLPEGDTEVGEISWSYLTAQDEQFNGTEISFPIDLNTTSKIMLLGVCFLLNFSRWQSSYLDSMYNPRKRKDKPSQGPVDENREVAALLKTSPEEHGFRNDEEGDGSRRENQS